MRVDEGTVGAALADAWEHLIGGIPAGWAERAPGAIAAVSRVGLPTLNGVFIYGADAERGAVSQLVDHVISAGIPFCLQLAPGVSEEVRELSREHDLKRDIDLPLMVLTDASRLPGANEGELQISLLEPAQAAVHAELAAAGFGAPEDDFRQLMTEAVVGLAGVSTYIGEVGGEAVVTGVGVRLGDSVGIFNIATLPGYRRRGYGTAITAQAVLGGLEQGARWAWLQSSPEGYRVYERIGFGTLESWECWIAG